MSQRKMKLPCQSSFFFYVEGFSVNNSSSASGSGEDNFSRYLQKDKATAKSFENRQ